LISSYYYDPFGRRLWKEVAGVRTYFVYADEGLVAEVDVAGNVVRSYGYKPGSTWSTDPLFMKVGGEYYFYQNDHLGTPQKLTAVNGAVVWSTKYSSFGEADVGISSSITNNLGFAGQYFDSETGLHYNWHRYYDPKTGRYLTPDPIGLQGGINLYAYVLNDPINAVDPLGLHGILLSGRGPWYVNIPRHLRVPYRAVQRNFPKQPHQQPRYVPEPAPDPVPSPSWLARFLKTFADLLGSGGAGSTGFGGVITPDTGEGSQCSNAGETKSDSWPSTDEEWSECYRIGLCQ
jgi:RHS repeat-associated protein